MIEVGKLTTSCLPNKKLMQWSHILGLLILLCASNESIWGYLRAKELKNFGVIDHKLKPQGLRAAKMGLTMDCYHNFNIDRGAAQKCLSISGLSLVLEEQINNQLFGQITINPFSTLHSRYERSSLYSNKPYLSDSYLAGLGDFAVIWSPRMKLDLSLELYDGTSHSVPSESGLPMSSLYRDFGWKQAAVSIAYHLPMLEGFMVKFVGGNGEGEVVSNFDPQQYFAFEFHGEVIKGLEVHGGMSMDGNSQGSQGNTWIMNRYQSECGLNNIELADQGFTSNRYFIGASLNGKLPFTHGLRLGLGWQRNSFADINKDKKSVPSLVDLEQCERLDPDTLLLEDPSQKVANTMQHTIVSLNGSYRILDTYFLGLDYEKRLIKSDIGFFQVCDTIELGQCIGESAPRNSIEQRAYTLGFGIDLNEGLVLSSGYRVESYTHLYKKIYYDGWANKASKSREVFSVRVAYNWKE